MHQVINYHGYILNEEVKCSVRACFLCVGF